MHSIAFRVHRVILPFNLEKRVGETVQDLEPPPLSPAVGDGRQEAELPSWAARLGLDGERRGQPVHGDILAVTLDDTTQSLSAPATVSLGIPVRPVGSPTCLRYSPEGIPFAYGFWFGVRGRSREEHSCWNLPFLCCPCLGEPGLLISLPSSSDVWL